MTYQPEGSGPTSVPGTGAGNVFAGNTQYGILFNGGTSASVSCNIIGLSPFGNVLPNSIGIFGHSANDVQVGSALDSLSRNVISGNQLGIQLLDVSGWNIENNYFGLNVSGTDFVPGTGGGVVIEHSINVHVGDGTVAGRNLFVGDIGGYGAVSVTAASDHNFVSGNWFGTNATGDAIVGSLSDAVVVQDGASFTTIADNVISQAIAEGIYVIGNHLPAILTSNTTIRGNRIGVLPVDLAPGNVTGDGIHIVDSSDNLVDGNTIVHVGGSGIILNGSNATGNTVTGNGIGTTISGTAAMPNGANGVLITSRTT